jgi:hypothetical protein
MHHTGWTVLATTGVILTASYMLWMIQRVFYGDINDNTADVPVPDLDAREHLALWPMVALMLLMGVASPIWMRAIDTAGAYLAQEPPQVQPADGNLEFRSPLPDLQANFDAPPYQLPGMDLKNEHATKLNLIPAAADATKKESKLRNISTAWSHPTIKADSNHNAEAK